ncbi:DUF2213 domain-containing protein [Novosphingobium pentaromativorans]|uniref:DUF2213 domain-containing protein n=1 Tax=Novosphingobium pentaromativorans US6-1 TaxID=1088721 RepID=G6E7J2_9SPHN|nr:DUF2213 domain-containing protein [Novosphingobium pentaromativorans]AIT81604.1 hypothetical protein JI59_18465 [Novosphingobium pentaromativorans US6-1]EHJ62815.1 hypothetical protein NSU_0327 [Novosphingobium pentaromativorans US6-1]
MAQFRDTLTLDAPRRTKDGFLAVRARAARTGVYQYLGSEIDPQNQHGLRDKGLVNVLRDDATVFDETAARSFIGKPITDNHPREAVTSENWRDHARGTVMGAMRDGDYLAFDLLLTDASAIRKVDGGKRELSNGYSADIEIGNFTAKDGTVCVARQTKITGNHVALVDAGRAGPECAIKDHAICDAITADELAKLQASLTKDSNMKKIVLDGLQVDLADADAVAVAIDKLQTKIATSDKALADAQSAHDKAMAAKDAEIDDLKSKVVDQAQIDALADAKAAVVADAKKIAGDKLGDTAGKTVADVRRMALDAKGIDTKDKSDDYVEARFDALKDASPNKPKVLDSIRNPQFVANDSASIHAAAKSARNR